MVDDLILHGDGAAEHTEPHAGQLPALLEQRQRDELAPGAAAGGIGLGKISREQKADAAAHERQRAGHAGCGQQQHEQPPVDQQHEDHDRERQRHPRGAGHRKQAAEAHAERADPRGDLQLPVFRAVGQTGRHGGEHGHEIAHDVGASENGVHARADRGLRMRHPARGDGDGDDILVHAVQRDHRRKHHERKIHAHKVPVVMHEARDEEEPEHVLHRRAEAGDLDGVVRRDDVHENEADRQEYAHRQIQRIAAGLQRRFAAEALIDHAAQRQQHQAFIPARRQDRHSQQIAQHIVDDDIHGERE